MPDPDGLLEIECDISVTWYPDVSRVDTLDADLQHELIFYKNKTFVPQPIEDIC